LKRNVESSVESSEDYVFIYSEDVKHSVCSSADKEHHGFDTHTHTHTHTAPVRCK